jgi:putative FmdB family regulatory protein
MKRVPIYEYRCEQGHQFEVMQRMSDEPLASCSECSAPVRRVFHPVAIHFKGSGFHNTDYGTRKRQREQAEGGGESKSQSKSDSNPAETKKSESGGDSKKTESAAA